MIDHAKDLLRQVDTVNKQSDEAAAMLVEEMREIEKQLGLEDKENWITADELQQISALADDMTKQLNSYSGHLDHAQRPLGPFHRRPPCVSWWRQDSDRRPLCSRRWGMVTFIPNSIWHRPHNKDITDTRDILKAHQLCMA